MLIEACDPMVVSKLGLSGLPASPAQANTSIYAASPIYGGVPGAASPIYGGVPGTGPAPQPQRLLAAGRGATDFVNTSVAGRRANEPVNVAPTLSSAMQDVRQPRYD